MKVNNVHSRRLPVPADRVGELLDELGGPADRLWPNERWPTSQLELDGPLAVGTVSRQGVFEMTQLRQRIDEYEPGRRVVFRLEPGLGVVGTHRFEVQPLGAQESRLVHTLDFRFEPRMVPVYPLIIRQHDALAEDLLDRAELAVTGRVANPARWPLPVRVANAIELAIARHRGMVPSPTVGHPDSVARGWGRAVAAVLLSIGALHAAWALGWYWPAGDERELAELVLSSGERERLDGLPPASMTWLVAFALTGAAAVVGTVAGGTRSRAVRGAGWGVAAAFLARGLIYPPLDVIGGLDDRYDRLDLALYSPLCLAIATSTAFTLRRTAG